MNTTLFFNGPRRWMLVDDNAEILAMLSAMVANLTDVTLECHDSPLSALTAFTEAPNEYELVITDFQMPEMDGVQLCHQLRAIVPEQKILLVTGSGYFTEFGARMEGFCGLLNKPYPPSALKSVLAAAGIDTEACTAHC